MPEQDDYHIPTLLNTIAAQAERIRRLEAENARLAREHNDLSAVVASLQQEGAGRMRQYD